MNKIPGFEPKKSIISFLFSFERIYSRKEVLEFVSKYPLFLESIFYDMIAIRKIIIDFSENPTGRFDLTREDLLSFDENRLIREIFIRNLEKANREITKFLNLYEYDVWKKKKESIYEFTRKYLSKEERFFLLDTTIEKLKTEKERFEKEVSPFFSMEKFPLTKRRYYGEFIHWNLDFLMEISICIEIMLEIYEIWK